jgi:hypothetical protein
MADADGATQISDLDEMINRINAIKKNGHGIAVGSRAHLEERAVSTVLLNFLFTLVLTISFRENGTEILQCMHFISWCTYSL